MLHPDPKLLVATRIFGASGQPWMWRQVVGLTGFRKELVCWERHNRETQPTIDVQEHVLRGRAAPYDDDGRWLYRLKAMRHGSFYAAIGDDRRQLETIFAIRKPDVVLCNFGDIAMRLLPTALSADVPLVAYFHGDFSFIRNRWYRWSLLRCLHDFAAIVVVTDAERQWLERNNVPPEKLHFIPCGAPTVLFNPRQERQDDVVRFVMVSRLSEDKGCDLSIEAFSRVAALNPKARLDIYGDGPTRVTLEALVSELHLSEKITFHGYVKEAALASALPKHDVFIQHSRIKEGAPVSIVEAMACALPVVATRVGGIPDQVEEGKTGYLVDQGDVTAMSHAMLALANDRTQREQMGQAGRKKAVQEHDSATRTPQLGALLMDVASRSRALVQREAVRP
jgi:colanic acid/amylovoran biosynthesis glycosyltransferase